MSDSPARKILVVDDEPAIRDSLRLLLKSNFSVYVAADGEEALAAIDASTPDLVLLDVMMPRLDGIEVLRRLQEKQIKVPVIMLTAAHTVKTAVQAMKCGAIDFLNKPFDVEELTNVILAHFEKEARVESLEVASPSGSSRYGAANLPEADFGPLVGKSGAMADLFSRVAQVAARESTVLITGESGTGKELIARQIHERSSRRNGPFVAINCAAIPESLIESELFGHEKGAFTHAVEKRLGHFELANGGTLFLDEIGELGLSVQVKMLRFLQEQEFYRVGRSKPIRVDVRIVAATNKNLEELVKQKTFRQDLFYRINVINLTIPPLRERYEDIPRLVSHFVKKLGRLYGERSIVVEPAALESLVTYQWPGNVRELENVIESLLALSQGDTILVSDLPRKVKDRTAVFDGNIAPVFAAGMGFEEAEKIFETDMIVKALKRANFVQTRAAELLGISRRILKYKMDKLGINEHAEVSGGDTTTGEGTASDERVPESEDVPRRSGGVEGEVEPQ
jgi:two-component system response regulator AtoC